MGKLFDLVNTINIALKDPKGFDWAELDRVMVDLHLKLTQPKWAIEDEALREECEKLLVQYAVNRYLAKKARLKKKYGGDHEN